MAKTRDEIFPPIDWVYKTSPRWKRRVIIQQYRDAWEKQQQETADWYAAQAAPSGAEPAPPAEAAGGGGDAAQRPSRSGGPRRPP